MYVLLILGNDGVLQHHPGRVGVGVVGVHVGHAHRLGDLRILNVFVVDDDAARREEMIVVVVVIDGRHFEIVALMTTGVNGAESLGYDVGIGV